MKISAKRIAVLSDHIRAESEHDMISIATECGFGRRPAETRSCWTIGDYCYLQAVCPSEDGQDQLIRFTQRGRGGAAFDLALGSQPSPHRTARQTQRSQLTKDDARRRIAVNIAKLPERLRNSKSKPGGGNSGSN